MEAIKSLGLVSVLNFLWGLSLITTAAGQNGIFSALFPTHIRLNSTAELKVTRELLEVKNTPPPPLRFYIDCSVRPRANSSNATLPHHTHIMDITNWNSPRYHKSIRIPENLNLEKMDGCGLVAAHLRTNEVLDAAPLKLESAQSFLVNPDRISKIFVQMEKSVYKPKDLVRVKMVFLDHNLIPSTVPNTKIEISVRDSRTFVVLNENSDNMTWNSTGIASFSFRLADQVNVGLWTLNITAGDIMKFQKFNVEKTVLPKFEATIMRPKYLVMKPEATAFTAEVRGFYSYGKSVHGDYTLKFFSQGAKHKAVTKHGVLTKGRAFVSLPVPPLAGQYQLEVNVSESTRTSLTGRWALAKETVEVVQEEPYQLTWLNPTETYNPGFPLNIQIAVSTWEKFPVVDPDPEALCISASTANHNSQNASLQRMCSSVPQNGIASFNLATFANTALFFKSLTVQYAHKSLKLQPVPRPFHSQSKVSLHFVLPDFGPKLQRGQAYEVNLVASRAVLKKVNYILWNGNEMVGSETAKLLLSSGGPLKNPVTVPTRNATLEIVVPRKTFSELQLVVYFVHKFVRKSEIISASTALPTENFVELTPSKFQMQPGDNFTLAIKSHSKSTVVVRAIDQMALFSSHATSPNHQNMPTNEDISAVGDNELDYDSSRTIIDFRNVFQKAGLTLLTNADLESSSINGSRRSIGSRSHQQGTADTINRRDVKPRTDLERTDRTETRFSEAWLWDEFLMDNDTQTFNHAAQVPNTMTSWYLTAFSVNKETGLALTQHPKIVQAFRPFFITPILPFSVVHGENFDLHVLIHNYLGKEALVQVTFVNNRDDFQFVDSRQREMENVTQHILVQPDSVEMVRFAIIPLKKGQVPIQIWAVADQAGDVVHQSLNVVMAGETYARNQVKKRIQISKQGKREVVIIAIRNKRSLGSRGLKLTCNVDLLPIQLNDSLTISGILDWNLGAGENNLAKIYPTVAAMDYLASLDKLTPGLRQKGVNILTQRYQTQLTYYNSAGHFSFMEEWYKRKSTPSTWLTAYLVQTFSAAKEYITIDSGVLINSVKFVLRRQNPITGEFLESAEHLRGTGKFMEKRLKEKYFSVSSRDSLRYGITAFIVLALEETRKSKAREALSNHRKNIENSILRGLKYIATDSSYQASDGYSLAVVTAALHVGNHVHKDRFLDKLERYAKITNPGSDNEMKHYEIDPQTSESSTSSISIEMTAYVLLAHLHRSQVAIGNSVPIVRWLYSKQNVDGNYYSTQDTVVAIKALAHYARISAFGVQKDEVINVTISTGKNHSFDVQVSSNNSINLQDLVIPKTTKSLSITFQGQGFCDLEYEEVHYGLKSVQEKESGFQVRTEWLPTSNPDYDYELRLCIKVKEEGEISGQVLAEVGLTTGFSFYEFEIEFLMDPENWISGNGFSMEQIEELKTSNITRIHTRKQGTEVHVLYKSMTNRPSCFNLPVAQVQHVKTNAKAHVHVFEYHNPGNDGTAAFDPAKLATICEICLETGTCDIVRDCVRT